jgi:hypothetical protein
MLLGVAIAPLVAALCVPGSRPILGEIFYDAAGDDGGYEFVEIFNPTSAPSTLAGATLQAGDGAGPGRWTTRWTGAPGDTIPAGGRFVIGGVHVTPAPQAVVRLDLQNGPDAVRLVWPDGAAEVVGYGPLAEPEYFCGAPALDVPSGTSLARVPDASDLGRNADDFRAAAPTPGRANQPGRDVAMLEGSLALAPELPAAGAAATLSGIAVNRGGEPLPAGAFELRATARDPAGDEDLGSVLSARPLPPGDTIAVTLPLPPLAAGKRRLLVHARLAGDENAANDADSLLVRIGPGPLEVTEIQFHPQSGEGEWVEVRNRSGGDLTIAAFTLADRRSAPGLPSGGRDPLPADSLAVLVQDRAAFLARRPSLDTTRVWQVRPWSSLNNSDDSSGVADVVTLREADGTPCERAAYSAAGVPDGVPLERREGLWVAAGDTRGTPLAPPRALPPLAAALALAPRRIAGAGSPATLGWSLPWPRGRIAVDLYDLAGRHVAQVLPETQVTGRGERGWSAGTLPPGVYVMVLLARPEDGGALLRATQPLRVAGAAR